MNQSTNPHILKRRARWLYELFTYDCVWKHRPRAFNVADPKSRAAQHFAVIHSGGNCVRTLESVTAHHRRTSVDLFYADVLREARTAKWGRRRKKQQANREAVVTVLRHKLTKAMWLTIYLPVADKVANRCSEQTRNALLGKT